MDAEVRPLFGMVTFHTGRFKWVKHVDFDVFADVWALAGVFTRVTVFLM